MSEKLLSCPFCGGKARFATRDGYPIIDCNSENHCQVIVETVECDSRDDAIAAWNTRTPDLAAVKEKLEAIKDASGVTVGIWGLANDALAMIEEKGEK